MTPPSTTVRHASRAVEEQGATSITRRVVVAGAIMLGAAIAPGAAGAIGPDTGTRVSRFTDATAVLRGTSLRSIKIDGPLNPFVRHTTMQRIRMLAPLSLREWGAVFGVSHTAVREWLREDPSRDKLAVTLSALEDAAALHRDLNSWLTAPLPGLDVRPLDLLRDDRWRAFRGALRAAPAPAPGLSRSEVEARRRAETSWAIADVDITPDEE